jgi:hypothetical protein
MLRETNRVVVGREKAPDIAGKQVMWCWFCTSLPHTQFERVWRWQRVNCCLVSCEFQANRSIIGGGGGRVILVAFLGE